MVGKIRDFNVKRESGGQERPVETPKRPARASRGVGGLGGATRRGPLQRMQERDPQGGSGAEARGGRAGRRGRAACGSRPSAERLPCTRHPPVGRERVRGAARWGRLRIPRPSRRTGVTQKLRVWSRGGRGWEQAVLTGTWDLRREKDAKAPWRCRAGGGGRTPWRVGPGPGRSAAGPSSVCPGHWGRGSSIR